MQVMLIGFNVEKSYEKDLEIEISTFTHMFFQKDDIMIKIDLI